MLEAMKSTFGNGFAGGFDLGTSPHGLSADLPPPVQETREGLSLSPPAKPLLTFLEPSAIPASPEGVYGRAVGFKRKKPGAYTNPEVRSACRCLREAAAKQAREGAHYLRLNDREFLWVYSAIEHDRNRTRKAIGKGLCEIGDLRATDSIWGILQAVMVRRMKGYRL